MTQFPYSNPSRANPLGTPPIFSHGDPTQEAPLPMTELEKQMREIELARSLLEFGACRIENPELAIHMSIAISLNRLANWITRTNNEPRTSSPRVREPFERNER